MATETLESTVPLEMQYLAAATQAVLYVASKMDIGAFNKAWPPSEWYGKLGRKVCVESGVRDTVEAELAKGVHDEVTKTCHAAGWSEQLELLANWAKHYGCGNCMEQSAMAFVCLRDQYHVAPLDWMAYDPKGNTFAHAFVIVGRDASTDPSDAKTWNKEAVLCDPYNGEATVVACRKLRLMSKTIYLLHRVG